MKKTNSPTTWDQYLQAAPPVYFSNRSHSSCSVNGRLSVMSELEGVMEILRDPNLHIAGLCTNDDVHIGNFLDIVVRRAKRDDLFGMIVTVSIGKKKPNLIRIQNEIAHQLGFSFEGQQRVNTTSFCFFPNTRSIKNAVTENAKQLSDKIRTQANSILFILYDLHARLDLAKIGVDHQLCKFILISRSEHILFSQMNAQRIISV